VDYGEGLIQMTTGSPYRLLYELKKLPEVEQVGCIVNMGDEINGIKVNDVVFPVAKKAVYINSEWFDIFDYTLLDGSFATFKDHPFSVVLTISEAQKYFGNVSAVGQTVAINGIDHIVQAVIADNPINSSFQWNVFVSINSYLSFPANKEDSENWRAFFYTIFVKLHSNADVVAVTQKINDIHTKNDEKSTALLNPLPEIYFDSEAPNAYMMQGNKKTVFLFSLLGVLLLITACINYINLVTVKTNMRRKEVGIKKIFGANSRVLFIQFVFESFALCLIAAVLSLIIIFLFSPFYHLLTEKTVLSFSSPVVWFILIIILLVTTLLNGVYPALMILSFRPMNFLKGIGLLKIKEGNLRRGLVFFQFVISTTLIVYSIIIYTQMNYIQQKDRGYNYKHVISINTPFYADNTAKLKTMISELQSESAITAVTLCSQEITGIYGLTRGGDWEGRDEDFQPFINLMGVDANYQKTLGLQIIEGRWFEDGNISDESNVILNETAIREWGIHEPYIGQRFHITGKRGQIIGVVKDFHFRSLHERIEPLVILNQWHNNMITMKTHPEQEKQAIQSVKAAWATHFPNDFFEYSFLDDSFKNLYKSEIKTSRMILLFSILAIFIALLGLFGLSMFSVKRRFKEIGIRKTLGASVSDIVLILLKEFLIPVSIAMPISFLLSYFWAERMLQYYVYRINIGWWMFTFAGIITLALTLLTVGWQTMKAAKENPVKAIKSQ
jgi:ABC-type antimicrobial peptide transport system permease subunit